MLTYAEKKIKIKKPAAPICFPFLLGGLGNREVFFVKTAWVYRVKEALYIIWCGVNRLGDSGLSRLGGTSAFVNTASQLLLTRRGKTRMDGVFVEILRTECLRPLTIIAIFIDFLRIFFK